jgi:hypothetical protein
MHRYSRSSHRANSRQPRATEKGLTASQISATNREIATRSVLAPLLPRRELPQPNTIGRDAYRHACR